MSAGVLRASKLAEPANSSSYFTLNGVDQYVTIPPFSTVGDYSKYRTVSVSPAEDLADIVDVTQNPLVEFGRVGSNYYGGVVNSIQVIDSSPLLGSAVMAGNDSVYAQLDNAVVIPSNTDFSIKFKMIWKDGGGSGGMRLLGKSSAVSGADRIEIFESGNGSWGNIQFIQGGSVRNIVGGFSGVTEGQALELEIRKVQSGGTQIVSSYIDGVLTGTPSSVSTTSGFTFDLLYSSDESNNNKMRAGAAIADLVVVHGATEYSWPLSEGADSAVINSNSSTGSNYDGVWVGALNWETIPPGANISIPMNDGSGNILKNSLDSSRYSDALIRNYDSAGGGWSTPELGVTFIRESLLKLDNINANAGVWDFVVDGDTMYIAAGTDGIYVVDVANKANPVHVRTIRMKDDLGAVTSKGTTAVHLFNGDLIAAARSIDWDITNETGLLAKYSRADVENPQWVKTLNPPDMVRTIIWKTYPTDGDYANNWYQGIEDNGTYLIVASQRYGITVVDPVTMTEVAQHTDTDVKVLFAEEVGTHSGGDGSVDLVVPDFAWTPGEHIGKRITNTTTHQHMIVLSNTHNTAVGRIETEGSLNWDTADGYCINEDVFYYEVSRVARSGNWFFFAGHAHVWPVDFTDPLNPVPAAPYNAPLLGTQMRIRDVFVSEDGNRLYASPNTNNDDYDFNRGLMYIDITDPTAVTGDDWNIVPFGAAGSFGAAGWNRAGDKGILSLYLIRNQYALLATEEKGIATYDISTDPPTLIGQRGDVHPPGTHLKAVYAWTDGGKDYVCYSDGNGTDPRNHNLFIDRVVMMGSTEYVIGLAPENAGAAAGTITQASSFEYSTAMERPIVIPEPTTIYEVGAVCASSSSASRSLKIGLFNAVISANPVYFHPTSQVQDGGSPVEFTLTVDNGTVQQEYSEAVSFNIPAGTYILKQISSGNVVMQNNFNDSGYHRFRQSGESWPNLGDPTAQPPTNESGGDIVTFMRARS